MPSFHEKYRAYTVSHASNELLVGKISQASGSLSGLEPLTDDTQPTPSESRELALRAAISVFESPVFDKSPVPTYRDIDVATLVCGAMRGLKHRDKKPMLTLGLPRRAKQYNRGIRYLRETAESQDNVPILTFIDEIDHTDRTEDFVVDRLKRIHKALLLATAPVPELMTDDPLSHPQTLTD